MKIMADLEAVNLGMDENEADIAEELQDFDESYETRSEASDCASEGSSDSEPSISSVSTAPSSINLEQQRKHKSKVKNAKVNEKHKKSAVSTKRPSQNGKSGGASSKKKRDRGGGGGGGGGSSSSMNKTTAITSTTVAASSATKSSSKYSEKKSSDNANAKKSRKKTSGAGVSGSTIVNSSNGSSAMGSEANASSNGESCAKDTLNDINQGSRLAAKSDESEAEDRVISAPPPPSFESDSESVDSDAAANVKRNGRKVISKSISPEKKMSSSGLSGGSGSKSKSYDYMTKLNYLFRDTRFFLIKSNNADNITLSKTKNVWATLPQNDANLNQAFKEARNVLLIFSVNESGKFAGFARMSAPSSKDIPQVAWVLPPSISPKALGGVIQLDWICRKELSFNCTSHLYNSWNEGKPVKIGRDGQEIEPKVGAELCRLFPEDEKIELTPILRKSKETAKMMRERGIRVIYKPPRSLSSRGSRGLGGGFRNGGPSSSGPIRHKRTYGSAPHRPYKIPPMGPPPSGFKRGSSPYRIGNGGPGGIGSSRSGGGDSLLPPWERYINSAAAEAYVADYMRTMHGQLPPLPFVPFGQLPLPPNGPAGAGMPPPGATPYEQLPPPVRYYDGPPLPDYPPPQAIRPPPPGFDKPPSYEDFAAWKNAGLPTVPPPGFPSLSTSNGSSSGAASNASGNFSQLGGGSAGGSAGGSGGNGSHSSYRSNRETNSNMNRSRERAGGPGGRDYRGGGGDRERHFRGSERGGGGSNGGHRTYRDSRR